MTQLAERGLEDRKRALGLHLVLHGIERDRAVAALVVARTEELARAGRPWPSHHAIVDFLDGYADRATERVRRSPARLAFLVRCKVVATLVGYALRELERAFAVVDDPAVIAGFESWRGLTEMLVDTVARRHGVATRSHYYGALLEPARWRRLPTTLY